MAGQSVGVFEDSPGQDTPVGFRDSPGQWYTAHHRKRGTSAHLSGEPTQRDSQVTQTASEDSAPVFFVAAASQEDTEGHVEDVDEEETQIRMTNSEEQDGSSKDERRILEQKVPLPLASAAVKTADRVDAVDTDDADSDMSDDMLEQDGSMAGLSSIAASFQQREIDEEALKRLKAQMAKRAPFRVSPVVSAHEDSSGGETEIEDDLLGEKPATGGNKPRSKKRATDTEQFEDRRTRNKSSLRLVKSASDSKTLVDVPDTKSIQRSASTPDHPAKREHEPDSADTATDRSRTKRSRHSKEVPPSSSQDEAPQVAVANDEDPQQKEPPEQDDPKQDVPPPEDDSDLKSTQGSTEDIRVAANELLSIENAEEKAPPSHATPRAKQKSPARRKRTANSRSVTESESSRTAIRVILTGLDATPATRKKIKAITGAVYETDIEKATHVVAPQNQLKRTVKLLCAISCCEHIVGTRWLDESARAGAPVDEQANCLHDEAAEAKWAFDLRRTMYDVPKAQRERLFAGRHVFITAHKSVLPPVKDLAKIIECAGGTASTKGKPGPTDLVITSEAAMGTATVQRQLAHANPERIYSPELILSSILQQNVALDKNRLKMATKRRN